MTLTRNTTSYFLRLLDMLPPFLRDSEVLWTLIFKSFFGKKYRYFLDFKKKAIFLDDKKYTEYYSSLMGAHIQRPTDLTDECVAFTLAHIKGQKVLDAGCGRGYLCEQLSKNKKLRITGTDIYLSSEVKKNAPKNVAYKQGSVEKLPFANRSFDTVICTHTLEHVPNLEQAIVELRRVTKQRLICIFPRQREYPYTFDLHVNFFPYEFSVQRAFKNPKATIVLSGTDWIYVENK